MNDDQYNNQNNPTYNTPVVVELLPTAVTNKNMTKDRTIMLTAFFCNREFCDSYASTHWILCRSLC